MTDAMIVNELEASGWKLADAQTAVEQSRTSFVPKPTPGFAQAAGVVEYDVPQEYHQQSRKKFIIGLIFAVPIIVLEVFTEDPSTGFSLYSLSLAVCILVFFSILGWFGLKRHTPRRIRLDKDGYTVLQPKGKLHPWTQYKSYHFGFPEAKSTWLKRFTQTSSLLPEAPTLVLQPKPSMWVRASEQESVQLPYPPQERKALEELLKQFFPVASAQKPAKLGWRYNPYIIVGLFIGVPGVLILLFVLILLN